MASQVAKLLAELDALDLEESSFLDATPSVPPVLALAVAPILPPPPPPAAPLAAQMPPQVYPYPTSEICGSRVELCGEFDHSRELQLNLLQQQISPFEQFAPIEVHTGIIKFDIRLKQLAKYRKGSMSEPNQDLQEEQIFIRGKFNSGGKEYQGGVIANMSASIGHVKKLLLQHIIPQVKNFDYFILKRPLKKNKWYTYDDEKVTVRDVSLSHGVLLTLERAPGTSFVVEGLDPAPETLKIDFLLRELAINSDHTTQIVRTKHKEISMEQKEKTYTPVTVPCQEKAVDWCAGCGHVYCVAHAGLGGIRASKFQFYNLCHSCSKVYKEWDDAMNLFQTSFHQHLENAKTAKRQALQNLMWGNQRAEVVYLLQEEANIPVDVGRMIFNYAVQNVIEIENSLLGQLSFRVGGLEFKSGEVPNKPSPSYELKVKGIPRMKISRARESGTYPSHAFHMYASSMT